MNTFGRPMASSGGFGYSGGGGGFNMGGGGGFASSGQPAVPVKPANVAELEYPPTECVSRVRFFPYQSGPEYILGACGWDKTCRLWRIGGVNPNTPPQSSPLAYTEHTAPILDMSYAPDGRVFFGGCCKTAMMWNTSTNQKSQVAAHDLPISCLAHVSNGVPQEMLITGSWDGRVRFWDLRQAKPAKEENFGEPVFAMDAERTSPFAAFATGRTVHVYNLATMQLFKSIPAPEAVKYNFRRIACHPRYEGVAATSAEGRICYLPMENQAALCVFKGHHKDVQSDGTGSAKLALYQSNMCCFHPNGCTGITGGADGRISIFNLKEKKHRAHVESHCSYKGKPVPISSGDLSPDGQLLAYACSYDWSLGKGMYDPQQPSSVYVRTVANEWLN